MSSALVSSLKLSSNFVSWRREEARWNRARWLSWRQSFCGRRRENLQHTYMHGVMQQERWILSRDLLFVQPASSPDPAQLVTTHCDENIVQDSCLDFSSRGYYFRAAFILFTSNCAATIWEQCIVHSRCLVNEILQVGGPHKLQNIDKCTPEHCWGCLQMRF